MRDRIKKILREYYTDSDGLTRVYHGTSYESWERKQERGFFYDQTYVTTNRDIAEHFAIFKKGEQGFHQDMFRYANEHYGKTDDGWKAFCAKWRPDTTRGILKIAYKLYGEEITPTILEMNIDLEKYGFKNLGDIRSASGAYTEERIPVDVVSEVYLLSWEEILKEWGISTLELDMK